MSLFTQMKSALSVILGQDVSEMSETELVQAVDDAAVASETVETVQTDEVGEASETADTTSVDTTELISALESRVAAQETNLNQLSTVVNLLAKKVAKSNVSVSTVKTASATDAVATTVAAINSNVQEVAEKTVKPLNLSEVVGSRFN
jgi:hypothetical protein